MTSEKKSHKRTNKEQDKIFLNLSQPNGPYRFNSVVS